MFDTALEVAFLIVLATHGAASALRFVASVGRSILRLLRRELHECWLALVEFWDEVKK